MNTRWSGGEGLQCQPSNLHCIYEPPHLLACPLHAVGMAAYIYGLVGSLSGNVARMRDCGGIEYQALFASIMFYITSSPSTYGGWLEASGNPANPTTGRI